MFAWGKGGDIFFFHIELLPVFVELDVIILHSSLFMQTFLTQGLSSIHVVDVKLDSILTTIGGCWIFPATSSIKTVE